MKRLALVLFVVAACGGNGSTPNPDVAAQQPADSAVVDGPGGGTIDVATPIIDGAVTIVVDGAAGPDVILPDAGFGPGVANCGGMMCSPPDVCCLDQATFDVSCEPSASCGMPVTCDGPEDCGLADDVCCLQVGTACQNESVCGLPVCHNDADCNGGECCQFGSGPRICMPMCQ